MASPPLLNLASLGRSLDHARRARRSDEHGPGSEVQPRVQPPYGRQDGAVHDLEPTRGTDSDPGVDSARGEVGGTAVDVGEVERPYPLCLLCLARPPSAVLLPCELLQTIQAVDR
jgi:hypothetical protein